MEVCEINYQLVDREAIASNDVGVVSLSNLVMHFLDVCAEYGIADLVIDWECEIFDWSDGHSGFFVMSETFPIIFENWLNVYRAGSRFKTPQYIALELELRKNKRAIMDSDGNLVPWNNDDDETVARLMDYIILTVE